MGMESGGLSVADVAALQNRNSDGSMLGGAGGTWVWVFFLFFLLDQGGVAEWGTHEELLEKGGIYAKLYAAQWSDFTET